jgi:hypothetical protein
LAIKTSSSGRDIGCAADAELPAEEAGFAAGEFAAGLAGDAPADAVVVVVVG